MTGVPRAPGTDQGARVAPDRKDDRDLSVEDEVPDEMPWPEADPDAPPEAASGWDAEIAAAAKGLFFARDLLRPGPGLFPFGARARDRRERRRQVDSLAAIRRAELSELLTARRNSRGERSGGTARRERPRVVAALLTAVVIAIAVAGWWMSRTATPPSSSQGAADTGPTATDPAGEGSDPSTPKAASSATVGQPVAVAVDLSSPEAAAASWLAAWCPIDPHRNPDAVAAGIRGAMTAEGWARFAATPGQLITDATPGVTASCSAPRARIVSRPPGSDTTVVVLVSATRTITSADNAGATRNFRIERRHYVVRGDDGLWRVDVPAVGG